MSSAFSISVLGDEFSFHHLAGIAVFGRDQHFVFSKDFDEMLAKLESGATDFCMLAVENSIAGDVPGNFQRIADNHLFIRNEIIIQIELCLGTLPGINMQDIQIVYSHPMGRKECSDFFDKNPQMQFESTSSTASGAKMIAENDLKNAAVITSKSAIEHYGLHVLASGIADHPDNQTRFFVLSRKSSIPQTTNKILKASLLLQFRDNQKSRSFDSVLKQADILQIKKLTDTKFFVETEFTEIYQYEHLLKTISENLCTAVELGIYETGEIISGL